MVCGQLGWARVIAVCAGRTCLLLPWWSPVPRPALVRWHEWPDSALSPSCGPGTLSWLVDSGCCGSKAALTLLEPGSVLLQVPRSPGFCAVHSGNPHPQRQPQPERVCECLPVSLLPCIVQVGLELRVSSASASQRALSSVFHHTQVYYFGGGVFV